MLLGVRAPSRALGVKRMDGVVGFELELELESELSLWFVMGPGLGVCRYREDADGLAPASMVPHGQ